ncbi:hypothetical protein [Labedella endophytica]|uniref:Uncharacterized protein n=1 Tax=Labedella endophytica TaxID=1523160 RepID=A0A3S0V8R2_9MICO|nr:hypothetical protein [Labedella endophytica]RUQ98121.1 hypothetical protein ELQ94_13930 [Labedella endophytica]
MTDAHEKDEPTQAPAATPAPIATEVGADVDRAPIADVGSAVFEGVEAYRPDEVFHGVATYSGDDAYTATPATGGSAAYEGASAYGVAGAYEPEGAYVPAVTPVAAEDIVPDGAAPSKSGEPARVDPIGVYVPEDVPAAALPQNEIADAEAASTDVSADAADALPGSAVAPETGEPVTPADATSGPSAVRFDD